MYTRKKGRQRRDGVYAGAMGRALPHKIAEPSSAAPPSRDSCKQTRVNLKMQIPPRDSLPLRGRTREKKRAVDREMEREMKETREDERGEKKRGAREHNASNAPRERELYYLRRRHKS